MRWLLPVLGSAIALTLVRRQAAVYVQGGGLYAGGGAPAPPAAPHLLSYGAIGGAGGGGSVDHALRVLLEELSLGAYWPAFAAEDLSLSLLRSLSPEALDRVLTRLPLPIGIQLRVAQALREGRARAPLAPAKAA